jgi:predicted ATPase
MVNPGESRANPLQYVTDPDNRRRMSDIFEKIFSKKIFCEDRGSTMITLHMGAEIAFNQAGRTPQEVSDELYRRMASLPKVHEQGDGIRSLAGLLLNMMMPNYTVFLIDEPEAFLHPPQARVLGENLANLLGERQAFISTHSIELIKGLLSTAGQRVKIVRLTREGDVNPVHYLQPADLDEIWRDPLMRHSNILDGLFYHHTVLCESDSDCQLYAAMLSHIKEEQNTYSDTLFTLCNGKGRMKPLSKQLKSLGIDYRIVPDLDFFNDEGLVKAVYENCGGVWADIEGDYQILFDAMNQPDGTLSPDDLTQEVRRMIDENGWTQMTKPHVNRLSKDLPKLLENQWDKLKHNGLDSIQEPAVKEAIERLISSMNEVGVFPVRNGELESLFPNVGSHGPGYAVAVLAQYPDLNAEEHRGLREVVTSWGI